MTTMKFMVESLGKVGERFGTLELSSISSCSVVPTATPFPLLLTKGGCVPHLTRETLAQLDPSWGSTWPVLAPLTSHVKQTKVLEKWGQGLAAFCGLKEHPLIMTIQDPGEETRSGYHGNKNVSVWNNCNKLHIEPTEYMELVSHSKTAAFLALCDGDTPVNCPNKRVSKAVSKSVEFLDNCLEKFQLGGDTESNAVIAAVEGGFGIKARRKSAQEAVARKEVGGFLLDGFHCNGASSELVTWEQVGQVFTETVELLPTDKPRFYFGCASPHLVFDMVKAGVDVFDTSFANMVTEREAALVFPNQFPCNNSLQLTPGVVELDMSQEVHKMDFSPLVSDCSCYTCRNFTKAYIHHLLAVKEMLGKVLLALHNLHHYREFFFALQQAIREDQVELFKKSVVGSS